MVYEIDFDDEALKEWKKLPQQIKEQLKKKLKERQINPKVPKDKLSGMKDVYKIKLRSAGYRLAYRVDDNRIIITVIVVGKREKDLVYKMLHDRAK